MSKLQHISFLFLFLFLQLKSVSMLRKFFAFQFRVFSKSSLFVLHYIIGNYVLHFCLVLGRTTSRTVRVMIHIPHPVIGIH